MRRPTLAAGVGCVVAATGMAAGIDPMSDNSLFTHIATGRLILAGHLPHSDPYTFTAHGQAWAVQSWFASVLYAGAEKLGGLELTRLSLALTAAALAVVGWILTRPARTLLGRLAAILPFLVVGFDGWGQRPLLLGLVFLGLALLAAEGVLDPRWLVPVGWAWLNVHGTWPLGLVALAALAAGRRLDGERPDAEIRAGLWLLGGLLLGSLNPYGPKLLVFPITLLRRRDALQGIVEWQPPRFDNVGQYGFLLLLVVAVVALRRAPSWRFVVPLALFTVAALLGARNVQVASLVLLPVLAAGLRDLGSVEGDDRSPVALAVAGAAVAMAVVVGATAFTGDPLNEQAYPVAALQFLRDNGYDRTQLRVVSQDFVGNFLELVSTTGRTDQFANVFIDDRAELTPIPVGKDYRTLLGGREGWEDALARYQPDMVLWQRELPLAQLLDISPGWRRIYEDRTFAIFVPA